MLRKIINFALPVRSLNVKSFKLLIFPQWFADTMKSGDSIQPVPSFERNYFIFFKRKKY